MIKYVAFNIFSMPLGLMQKITDSSIRKTFPKNIWTDNMIFGQPYWVQMFTQKAFGIWHYLTMRKIHYIAKPRFFLNLNCVYLYTFCNLDKPQLLQGLAAQAVC